MRVRNEFEMRAREEIGNSLSCVLGVESPAVFERIEKALGFKLYDAQKGYLLSKNRYMYARGRGSGKTLAYCIKLALSEGIPLDMRKSEEFSDREEPHSYNKGYFRDMFYKVWASLKKQGFKVRELRGVK